MNFQELGFGYPDNRGRLFASRERRKFPATVSPQTCGVAYSSLYPTSQVVRIPVQIAHGEHTDNWRAKLSFKLRVPNADMFRRWAVVDTTNLPPQLDLPPESWVMIDSGPPLLVPSRDRLRLLPGLPYENRPRVHQATRLIRRLRVLAGSREEVLFDQQRFDLVAELDRWQTEQAPEVVCEAVALQSSGATMTVAPQTVARRVTTTEGVDICSSNDDLDALYSADGLAVTMSLPLSIFGDKGFWPGVESFVIEMYMNDAREAFNIENFPRDAERYELAPLALIGPPRLAQHYHAAVSAQLPIDERYFGYEVFEVTYNTDVVRFSEQAQRAVETALSSGALHTTYEALTPFDTNLAQDRTTLEIRSPFVLSNITRWQTFFRRASRIPDLYFDSYSMVNPSVHTARWSQGNDLLDTEPLRLCDMFAAAVKAKNLWETSKRMTRLKFYGDWSARANTQDWCIGGSLVGTAPTRMHITYAQASCFVVAKNFERDRDGDSNERKISGRSSGEDSCVKLSLTRSAPIINEQALRRALKYNLVRWPYTHWRQSTGVRSRLTKREEWPYVPRFARGLDTPAYEMLANLRASFSWTVRHGIVSFSPATVDFVSINATTQRFYDGRDFESADVFTSSLLATNTMEQALHVFPQVDDYYIATTVLAHTRVVTWGRYGVVSVSQ